MNISAKISVWILFCSTFCVFWGCATVSNAEPKKESVFSPKNILLIDSFEGVLLGASDKNLLLLKAGKVKNIAQETRLVEAARFSPNGQHVAYFSHKAEDATYELKVYSLKNEKLVFTSEARPLLSTIQWINDCRLLISSSESNPPQVYSYAIDDDCAPQISLNSVLHVVSNTRGTSWRVGKDLKLKVDAAIKSSAYQVRRVGNRLVGSLASGGIFYIDSQSKTHVHNEGYRSTSHASRELIAYEVPEKGIFIWDLKKNTHTEFAQGSYPFFLDSQRIVYFKNNTLWIKNIP
jgi:hypothetical protein